MVKNLWNRLYSQLFNKAGRLMRLLYQREFDIRDKIIRLIIRNIAIKALNLGNYTH